MKYRMLEIRELEDFGPIIGIVDGEELVCPFIRFSHLHVCCPACACFLEATCLYKNKSIGQINLTGTGGVPAFFCQYYGADQQSIFLGVKHNS